jgi:hypothetical protein
MSPAAHTRSKRLARREAVLDLYTLILGAGLLVSPLFLKLTNGHAQADAWVSGGIVVVASLAAVLMFSPWEEWINLALGIWVIVSPWILGFAHTHAMWLNIWVGALITYLAGLELWLIHYGTPTLDTDRADAESARAARQKQGSAS